ncbi:hypothetical protein BKK51_09860 [Rodentibacter trehalosifermentans]|uniref:Uncharacterized protein n=1 Tax=Rodentibacter trehalosifermentans TaxID=1908263 RepID=A0A1V3IPI2_9PAST|nr:hypothetical protein [Rodentibacter trehalosifermentans]OOF44182.1 hypothetical protein BKK51_09860 [Rodentibacter trehalosifermentans]OOF47274.1 hypothetical protein BKK52_09780 [Rodentibacter trehalosifermentans]
MKGFNRENSSILGFITLCKAMKSITDDEFKQFFYSLINDSDLEELPYFIWDSVDLRDSDMSDIYNMVGFVPSSNLNDDEINAIYGITVKRFGSIFDMLISNEEALDALERNPHILERFKREFPFIKLDFDVSTTKGLAEIHVRTN